MPRFVFNHEKSIGKSTTVVYHPYERFLRVPEIGRWVQPSRPVHDAVVPHDGIFGLNRIEDGYRILGNEGAMQILADEVGVALEINRARSSREGNGKSSVGRRGGSNSLAWADISIIELYIWHVAFTYLDRAIVLAECFIELNANPGLA